MSEADRGSSRNPEGQPSPQWDEQASAVYRRLVSVAVPEREEQIATLLTLIPIPVTPDATGREDYRIVELGCGTGTLSYAMLDSFPGARVIALDGSESMRDRARRYAAPFGDRFQVQAFHLSAQEWHPMLRGADAVVSSLCIHHLPGARKRELFASIYRELAPTGALLIADLVAPQRAEAEEIFRTSWDEEAKKRARRLGAPELFDTFRKQEWNWYRYPDPVDHPSPLFTQLQWLSEIGYQGVDCFWLRAGHAVFGGYRSRARSTSPLSFRDALGAARRAAAATA